MCQAVHDAHRAPKVVRLFSCNAVYTIAIVIGNEIFRFCTFFAPLFGIVLAHKS
jgi:hypothetical protein